MTTTLDRFTPELRVTADAGCRLIAVGASLWRVVGPRGLILGHLQALSLEHGTAFRARRYHVLSGSFRDIGDFWSAEDAVECLRLST